MNNKQKKVLCLALLLTSAPAVLRAVEGSGVGVQVDEEIQVDPNPALQAPVANPIAPVANPVAQEDNPVAQEDNPGDQPAASRFNVCRRALERISGARQATQERWDGLSPRTKTATKVVAGAGVLGAVGFLGHKLYKWWTKPVVKVEVKSWEARFVDFNESVLTPIIKEHAPETEHDLDAGLLRSVVSEAVETLQPHHLLANDAFVGLLTPEQKAELEEICALAEAEVEASRA